MNYGICEHKYAAMQMMNCYFQHNNVLLNLCKKCFKWWHTKYQYYFRQWNE